MPIKDITGQTFGNLTVLRLSEKRNPTNNKILWECQCSCGNPEIVYATTANLTQGYKTSCGCLKKAQVEQAFSQSHKRKDLTGQTFGKLTALYYIENTSPPLWHCRCECGNEVDAISTDLTRLRKKSCGCGIRDLRKSLIGQKFGKLTVVSRAENYISPKGQSLVQYSCKCDCGKENIVVMATSLQSGSTKSCGCLRSNGEAMVEAFLKEKGIDFQREYRIENCKDIRPLPFDFCIFNKEKKIAFLIEINGKQHYEPKFSSDAEKSQELLEIQQKHDIIKQNYCLNNSIDLLIIPYYDIPKYKILIEERLKKYDL